MRHFRGQQPGKRTVSLRSERRPRQEVNHSELRICAHGAASEKLQVEEIIQTLHGSYAPSETFRKDFGQPISGCQLRR
jgi:hypothetical protein